ncbi:MAG: ABC transporter substrate-binding protein [Brevinematales bacterium]|nr:ABC transporter substrate-binding protein [Brevinematales bacterium]
MKVFIILILQVILLYSCVEQTKPSYFKKADEKNNTLSQKEEKNDNKIRISVFPNFDLAYKELVVEFEKENPDLKVEFSVLGFGEHHNMIINNIIKEKPLPDVILTEAAYIDSLSPIFENLYDEPYNAKEFKSLFFPYKWKMASKNENSIISIPIDISPACVWYRIDIFEERNVKIDTIQYLEDLYIAGKNLTFDKNGDGKIDHWLLPNAELIFEMILHSSDYRYFDKDGNPDLNNPTTALAIQWAKEFRKAGYDAKVNEWTMEWYKGLNDGLFAYTISGAWLGWHLQNWIAPDAKGKFRIAKLPALSKKSNKPMNFNKGGSFIGIHKNAPSEKKLAAWKLIKWLATRKESQIITYKKADALPAIISAWEDKIFDEGISYLGGQNPRPLWKEMSMDIKESYVDMRSFYAKKFLYQALIEVLYDKKDVNKALDDAQKNFVNKLNQF